MEYKIKTVAEFAEALGQFSLDKGDVRFFRGHDNKSYRMVPGVYRDDSLIKNENNLVRECVIRCPEQFPGTLPFFEVLVKLQHYGLPTRLLDLTTNALAALFFACQGAVETLGEVIVLDIPKKEVKYYDSDTVAVISNVARRGTLFNLDKLPKEVAQFNKESVVQRLLHHVRAHQPAFRPVIKPSDLRRVVAVRAKLDNARIIRQEGAFLLYGMDGPKTVCPKIPSEWIVCGNRDKIVISDKATLRKELKSFGISDQTLFPELASQTKAVVDMYRES